MNLPRRGRFGSSTTPQEPPTDAPRLAALRLLGRRDLTAAELTARLLDKGYPPADVAVEVDRLVTERAVDDRRLAATVADTASRIKGRGRLRIRRELEGRGVAKAIIDDVLTAALTASDELSAVRQFLARRGIDHRAAPAERRRVFQQLLRRGFSADIIGKALRLDDD